MNQFERKIKEIFSYDKCKVKERKSDEQLIVSINSQLQQNSSKIHPFIWSFMIGFCVVIYGSYPVLMQLSKVDGQLQYSSFSLVLVVEIGKLLVCISFLLPVLCCGHLKVPTFKQSVPFCLPAVLYCFTNNMAVHMQSEMDSATYQVLGNFKIFTTAVLYRAMMKRPITGAQWLALSLLVAAGILNSFGGYTGDKLIDYSVVHVTTKGLVMMSVACTVSAFAGVYSEYIMKDTYELSIHVQNGMLYTYGAIFNALIWLHRYINSEVDEGSPGKLLQGFNAFTWVVILMQVCIGLLMSVIMKHSNNITRIFVISSAMLVNTFLSVLLLQLHLNVFFCTAFLLVVMSLFIYYQAAKK